MHVELVLEAVPPVDDGDVHVPAEHVAVVERTLDGLTVADAARGGGCDEDPRPAG